MKYLCAAVLCLLALCATCRAAPYDYDDYSALERAVPDGALDKSVNLDNADLATGGQALLKGVQKELPGILGNTMKNALAVFAIACLSALAMSILDGAGVKTAPKAVGIATALAITGTVMANADGIVSTAADAMNRLNSFSKVLIPTLAGAAAAQGGVNSASVRSVATVLFSDGIISLINYGLIPMMYLHIAAITVGAATGNALVGKIADMLKWLSGGILKVVLIIYTTYITLNGILAGTTDAVAAKAVKTTVSGMVPVVGGVISDAAESVMTGAAVIKNSIGIFGMFAVLGTLLSPFLLIGTQVVMFKLFSAFSAPLCETGTAKLIDGFGDAFSMLLGMLAASAAVIIISIALTIMAVSPL